MNAGTEPNPRNVTLMQLTQRLLVSVALAAACCATIPATQATSLLLDFGPTLAAGTDRALSPGHYTGIVPASELTWNRITGDSNTLYYGDGTAATGVSLNLGRSTAVGPVGDDTINFNDNGFTVSALGGSINTGVYAGTSPVKDGIFGGSFGTNNLAVGLRVDGLPAGTYRVVVHGRNSSAASIASVLFYATNGASATTYAFTMNDATVQLVNAVPAITTGFLDGDGIGILTVTLTAGQSLYVACEGTIAAEMRGFFTAIAIVSGSADLPAKITAQPANRNVMETAIASFTADGWGSPAVFKQWRLNGTNNLTDGPNISGANSNRLTLRNITPAMAGNYSLFVSNYLGTDVSSNALLTVAPVLNTEQMSNVWNILPGDRAYVSTGSTERGLAFNNFSTNLLMVSRTPSNQIVVLDPFTGAEKHFLNLSGVVDGTLPLNVIGVAADGAVYAANLTTTATSPSYKIYRWADDSPSTTSFPVFIGDPGLGVQPNLRWGDNIAVRGAGADTQILIAPGSGTNVVLLRTSSGVDFQTEIAPAVIAVSGVPTGFGAITLGLSFGPSTNTFWAKSGSGALYLIQFDLNSNTAAVIQTFASPIVAATLRGIAADPSQSFLAGVAVEAPNDNVRIYDISNLTIGPVLRDQEAFGTQNSNPNGTAATAFGMNHLFALDSNNGLKAFALNTNYVPPSVSISGQPTDRTVMEGATAIFTATAASAQPLDYRWRFNGTNTLSNGGNISGANTNTLVISNVGSNFAGTYSLFVSNAFGTATSSNAVLTVLPTFNSAQMSNIWSLQPGERTYLGTNTSTERGLAYNSATTNLLLVTRLTADPAVVVLDARTGAEKHFLDVSGIPGTVAGVSLGLNTIGAAADGAVFGASVAVNATTTPLYVYRWDSDAAAAVRSTVFDGDPMVSHLPGQGYGDTMAVRGAGASTQILLPPRAGTNMVLLRTSSGLDFKNEVPPAVIAVSGVPSAFAQLGVAFGPGTNTFWAKTINNALYLIQFDLSTDPGTGIVLQAYSNSVPGNLRAISVDAAQKYLAGITLDAWANVRLYEISDLGGGPVLRDQEVFATSNPNVTVGGTGATAIGGNYVFALDSNNGIKAFLINPNYIPPLSPFLITSVTRSGDAVVITWASSSNRTYQVQARDSLTTGDWGNLGSSITASGSSTSFTNVSASDGRYYRVGGQ